MLIVKGKIPNTMNEYQVRCMLSQYEFNDFVKFAGENIIILEDGKYYYEKDLKRYLNSLVKPKIKKEYKNKKIKRGKR